jgi:hypothetical protein
MADEDCPMKTPLAALLAAACVLGVAACDKKDAPAGASKPAAGGTAKKALPELPKDGDPLQMAKDAVIKAVSDQVSKIGEFATKLKDNASKVAADQKPEFDKAVAAIDDGLAKLNAKIDEMKKAGAMQWQPIEAEVTDTAAKLYNDAKAAVEKWVK